MLENFIVILFAVLMVFAIYCTWKFTPYRFVVWEHKLTHQRKITTYSVNLDANWEVFQFGWHIVVSRGLGKGYRFEKLSKPIK